MNNLPVTIAKDPILKPAEDYYRLRQEGIALIAKMGSQLWTDYNAHDPGITILDALCYAITDLAYRIGWAPEDILAPSTPTLDANEPFPDQPFFTAREILTVNPWTPDDFRRLLIDLDLVRNGWVICKSCACDVYYYAWCKEDQFVLAYHKPDPNPGEPPPNAQKVEPQGLYDVLLELEDDPELGNLNDRKIERRYPIFDDEGNQHYLTLELRFPAYFLDGSLVVSALEVASLGATPTYNVLTDTTLDAAGRDQYLRNHWNAIWYLSFMFNGNPVPIEHVTLRLFGNSTIKNQATVSDLQSRLEEQSELGFVSRYQKKLDKAGKAITKAKHALHCHRNLDEDYCHIRSVAVEEVAVCADIEVTPDVDIERVQAEIWFRIEQYFNPPVAFYTLQELLDEGMPVEEIFNGPRLKNGFLKTTALAKATLKTELRTSDLTNLLLDIAGVTAINNLLLTKYDAAGQVVTGAADPTWHATTGAPLFDSSKVSAAWVLFVSPMHQARLYRNQSRFLFYQNGLPFQPRLEEATDTLMQLRGEAERPKVGNARNNLSISVGTFRDVEEYTPVQYSFPLTYGIGPVGLPAIASSMRQAQAKQLKAYLMVFEQLLGNAFAQLAHTADLFSLNPTVNRTYFVRKFTEDVIQGYTEIVAGLSEVKLNQLVETEPEFSTRRNQFLDHILARFGEQFSEYTLLLTNQHGEQIAQKQLIDDKIDFLKQYPNLSRTRATAFDYTKSPSSALNQSGLEARISLLLGDLDLQRMIVVEHLLLRPKFFGDALYPLCSDGPCATCGEEDPYSFRLTFVMPGWLEPFNENLELRRFADRTIRQETPAHLLSKICWVGNDGFAEDGCDPVITTLAEQLVTQGVTSAGEMPSSEAACACATDLYRAFSQIFRDWYQERLLEHFPSAALTLALEKLFQTFLSPTTVSCAIVLDAQLWEELQAIMVRHFHDIALHGWQFARFEAAWSAWLDANSLIDWTEERVPERVEAILVQNVLPPTGALNKEQMDTLCKWSVKIVVAYGTAFSDWLEENLNAGLALKDFSAFQPPAVLLHPDFKYKSAAATTAAIASLLLERYRNYTTVSYRLRVVVNLLSQLSNTYPQASLHDCDVGSDVNPVRLGYTALGN